MNQKREQKNDGLTDGDLHVSPITAKSRIIRWNSPEGMVILHLYSSFGIPKCSVSISINFNSKSEILSWSIQCQGGGG